MTRKTFAGLLTCVVSAGLFSTPIGAQISKTAMEMKIDELKKRLDEGQKVLVVDVRTEEEVKSGSIPGAVNIPMAELEARMKDIAKDVRIVFACDHGARSSQAADLYTKHGYTASTYCVLDEWKARGHKIGPTARPASGEIKPGAAKQ